jgi:hypothetical protein
MQVELSGEQIEWLVRTVDRRVEERGTAPDDIGSSTITALLAAAAMPMPSRVTPTERSPSRVLDEGEAHALCELIKRAEGNGWTLSNAARSARRKLCENEVRRKPPNPFGDVTPDPGDDRGAWRSFPGGVGD